MSAVDNKSRRKFIRLSGGVAAAGIMSGASFLLGCSKGETNPSYKRISPVKNIKGKHVRTVRGPMLPGNLGFTSMHEHTLFRPTPGPLKSLKVYDAETIVNASVLMAPQPVPDNYFPEKTHPLTLKNRGYLQHHYPHAEKVFELNEELMTDEIKDFISIGGQSILDCSVPYERGDPSVVKRMSEQTGANIVMSTGINSAAIVPKRYKNMNVAEIISFFEKEIHHGIDGTGIQAGNIKLLVDSKSVSGEDELTSNGTFMLALEAASNVSANSGAPVMIHSYHLSQQEFSLVLTAAKMFGMPAERLIFSHFDTMIRELRYEKILNNPKSLSINLDLGRRAMDLGSTLSFDLLGADWGNGVGLAGHNDAYALAAIAQYVREGYGDRLVIGTDTWNRLSTRRFGGHGMGHLLNYITPTLLKFGVTQENLGEITHHNPARLLAF